MHQADDNTLLRQYVENQSDEAFAALVTRHVDLVYSVALRQVGNPHHAEEITQAVFIILAKKAAQLLQVKALSSWLFQATRLTANNFVRSEIRRHSREQEAHMQSILNESGTGVWARIAPLLDTAVAGLREKERQAIVLRFYEGRDMRDIGMVLGASEDAAEKRVSRALGKLRKFFTKRGVTLTVTAIAGAVATNSVQAAPVGLAKTISAVAFTKGATASVSTLTLIKGALKIMAWSKMKTVIAVGVGVLLAVGTTTSIVHHVEADESDAADSAWRFANITSDTVEKLPPEVKILPTIFPGGNMQEGGGSNSDKFVGISQPAVNIVWAAYNWPQARVIFANGEPTNRYDFITTLNQGSREALQQELKDKLGLVAHQETKNTDALLLELVNPNAPGLHPPTQEKYSYLNHIRNRVEIKWADEPISKLRVYLESGSQWPIFDATGDMKRYSIDLKWSEKDPFDAQHKALQKVLLDQLGLELVPTNMPVEMLVVEKAK